MAAHPHSGPHAADRTSTGTKLLIALQWALIAVGIFCLTGAAARLMASTPDAWPSEHQSTFIADRALFISVRGKFMHFQDAYELIQVFGPRATARTLSKATGISARTLTRLAAESGITLRNMIEPISRMEHLPGLPNFTESLAWRGGSIHRIDLSKAGDSPGYRSLLIHQSGVQGQDEEDAP